MAPGAKVKLENARKYNGPWDRLPDEEVLRRQQRFRDRLKLCGWQTVTQRNRAIRWAYVYGGLPYQQIADATGLSRTHVRRIVNEKARPGRGRYRPPPRAPGAERRRQRRLERLLMAIDRYERIDSWPRLAAFFRGKDTADNLQHFVKNNAPLEAKRVSALFAERRRRKREQALDELCRAYHAMAIAYGRLPTRDEVASDGRRFGFRRGHAQHVLGSGWLRAIRNACPARGLRLPKK